MKRIFLALLLVLLSAVGVWALGVGEIVDVKGSINSVDAEKGIVMAGGINYIVDSMSRIVVDGKNATINNLASGMKVTGSGEVTRSGGLRKDPEITLRTIIATSPSSDNPQALPGAAGKPDSASTTPEAKEFKQKLAETFWMIENTPVATAGIHPSASQPPQERRPNSWISLNVNGTMTLGWSNPQGSWDVENESLIWINFNGPESGQKTTYRFNADLTRGQSVGDSPECATTLIRINSPTQAMRDKTTVVPPPETKVIVLSKRTPSPAPPPSPETQNAAAEVIQANHGNLVFVTGKEGAGNGFIATFNGANFLVTNAHVAAGISNADFKTLDGTAVKGGAAAVAVGHDIFCMSLPTVTGKPFEIMQGVDANAKIGDDVVVLGNADGAGVINTIMGKIVGIGPSLVEVDAQFIPGNSGSPIVHIKTGKVIGVATYLVTRKYDATTHEKMATPEVRRYGYRIDSVKTWQTVNWQTFYANADAMEKIRTLTADLDDFFRDLSENKGKVTPERHSNPVIKSRIAQWQEDKRGGRSAADRQDADANFLSFLKIACQSDINAVQGRLSYDYFQRQLSDEQETRTEISKAFTEIIQDIQK